MRAQATPIDEIDESSLEMLRILDGRPATGAELSNLVNPLEAALWGQVCLPACLYKLALSVRGAHRL
eukprot:1231070-Pleurochrysis_carterae.AAC.1